MFRLAGGALKALGSKLGTNLSGSLGKMTKLEIAMNMAPDIVMGTMYGASTPGGITDKVITGLGSAVGGSVGGFGMRGALGIKNPMIGMGVDYMGSIAGDMAGVSVADNVVRARHGGVTPMERQMYQQQIELEDRMKREAKEELLQSLALRQRFQ